ncbi:MAG: methyl-accepting chemotaxis protein [Candidatus Kapaibacterium sp.]
MKWINNMKIGNRLNIFVGGVVLICFVGLGLYIYDFVHETIDETYTESINEYLDNYTEMIKLEVESKQEKVNVAMNLASVYFNSLGTININPDTKIKIGRFEVNQWTFNGRQIQKSTQSVDRFTDMGIQLSSIFQETPEGYVRIATSVVGEDGERAIGSVIPYDSEIAKTVRRGERYIGRSFVLGEWLIAAYEPIRQNGRIVGIIAVAEPEINYKYFSEVFSEKSYFGSGYPYIVDMNGVLTAHPASVGTSLAEYDFFTEMKQNKEGKVVYDWKGREKTQYYRYIDAIDSYITVGWYTEDYQAIFNALTMVLVIGTLIALILVIGVLIWIVRNVVKAIKSSVAAAESIAEGDLNIDLEAKSEDETGQLLRAMKSMAGTINRLVDQLHGTTNAAKNGQLDKRADEEGFHGDYKKIIEGINGTLDAVITPLNVTAEYVDRISKGDIPPRITDDYKGDFNEIKNNLNLCIDVMNGLFDETNMLIESTRNGQLDRRGNAEKFVGGWGDLVRGINDLVDAFVAPINVTAEYIDRISKGDVPPAITDDYKGDFNEIKNNLNLCIDVMNGLFDETGRLIESVREGQLDRRGQAEKFVGGWGNLVGGINDIVDAFVAPINVTAEYIDRISKGDIPPKLTEEYKGDFNEIKNNLNLCIDSVARLVTDANSLARMAIKGKLRERADETKHNGDFRKIIHGVNRSLDSIVTMLDAAPAPMMVIDTDFRVQFMNESGARLDNKSGEQIEGMRCDEHFRTEDCKTGECACHQAIIKKSKVTEETVARVGGHELDIQYSGVPIYDEDGNIIGAFEVVSDQTAIKEEMRRQEKIGDYQTLNTRKIVEAMDELAKGNFQARADLDEPDEDTKRAYNILSEIVTAIRQFTGAVFELQKDVVSLSKSAVAGRLRERADVSKHHGEFAEIVSGFNDTLNAVIDPINEAGSVLEKMAGGDLTIRMTGEYKGDLADLKNDLNSMGDSLSNLIHRVSEAVQTVASSILQISSTSDTMATAAQEQSAQADEVASAVEEMSRTVTENAMSATRTAEMSKKSSDIAQESGRVVEQTVGKMRDIADVVRQSAENIEKLGESSKEIGEIIAVIDDIADQTNLLALNAAIEAARAGEQGRGFAVVADEVRKLAERTTEATKQIASMIKGIQNETQDAVRVMNQGNEEVNSGIELADRAGGALQEILSSSQDVLDMINQIAAASEEQSATSEQIAKNVGAISSVTSESAQQIQDIAHSADDLSKLTEHLTQLIDQFKVSSAEGSAEYGGSKGERLHSGDSKKLLGSRQE